MKIVLSRINGNSFHLVLSNKFENFLCCVRVFFSPHFSIVISRLSILTQKPLQQKKKEFLSKMKRL